MRYELKAAAHFARKYPGAQVLLRRSILKWGTKGSGDMDILLRLPGANELILIEAKLTAAAAAKSGALRKFMQKIARHSTVVIEEGAAALPIKKFILQVGQALPGTVRQKLETELRNDNSRTQGLIPTGDRLIKDILD